MWRNSLVFLSLTLFLTACSSAGPVTQNPDPMERSRERAGSLFGDGITFGGTDRGGERGAGTGVAVNSYLWRASLDTISFFPMAQVDAFGGVIITEWHSLPEAPNERYKLNVYILGRELRADGVRVAIFKQARASNGEWRDVPVPEGAATEVENAILTRARQIRINTQAQLE